MLHSMTTRLIHMYYLDTFHLCCGSGINQLSLRVMGIKSLFWYHVYNTLSRARLVAEWETKWTGASHWITCSYANPQCQIGCLFLFLELYNLHFTYRLTYLAPLARAQFLVKLGGFRLTYFFLAISFFKLGGFRLTYFFLAISFFLLSSFFF